jgi:oligopeptide/dipeptide ABC transporter ATP-binding protein
VPRRRPGRAARRAERHLPSDAAGTPRLIDKGGSAAFPAPCLARARPSSLYLVAYDLSVVKHVSDRLAVMYVGKIVEFAPIAEILARPLHPYSEALLSAVPVPDPRWRSSRIVLRGEVADPANPSGCHFHPRCPYAIDRCRSEEPTLRQLANGHLARCHRAEELSLGGVQEGGETRAPRLRAVAH